MAGQNGKNRVFPDAAPEGDTDRAQDPDRAPPFRFWAMSQPVFARSFAGGRRGTAPNAENATLVGSEVSECEKRNFSRAHSTGRPRLDDPE